MKRKLLFAIVALMCSVGTWAYQTPEANGIYYLYNTACTDGTPGFMSTGNAYGFQVVIDNFGFPVKLIDAGDGKFKIQFIHHEGYLSDNGWMYSDGGGDTDRPRVIEIQDQGSGNYKLYNTNNSTWIEDWYTDVVGDGTENRHNYIWQFLSKAERDAMVAGYTTSVKLAAATSMGMPTSVDTESEFDDYLSTNYIAIDQSSKITNGTFDTTHNTTDWSTTANGNRTFNIGWGNKDPKDTPEVYEGAGYLTHTTITVDKVGLYKVSVNATYRCGNAENNNRVGDLGYDGSVAYLKANNSFTKVPDWYSGKINGNGPDSPSEANSTYFSAGKYLTEVYVYVGDAKTIDISLHSHAFTWGGWLMFNNFKLTYYSDEVSDDDATAILATATTLEAQEMDADVLSALSSAKSTFNGARTIANYNALQTAIDNAQESADAYALFAPERTKALALGMTSEAIAALAPDVHALMVAEYNFVTTNYSYGVSLGTWAKTNAIDRSGQHWDGSSGSTYSEQNEGWGSASWTCSYSQNLTLPAGDYVFKVAGRKSSDSAVLTLTVRNGETTLGTVNDFPNGDTGKGIDTSGATNFGDGTYANNGTGRGWQWRYVKFTLEDPATVTVAVTGSASAQYQWVGFCNATVQTNDGDNVDLMTSLVNLNSAITSATLSKNTTNVGTGVFQLNETTNNTLWSAYETAKSNAEGYTLTSSSTADEVDALTAALNTAKGNYNDQALNAPEVGKHYYIKVATAGHAKNGNAVVIGRQPYPVMSGNYISDQTGFTFNASAAPAAYLAQAVTFTQVEGNTYNIAFEREEGTVYMTYGSLNNSKVNWKDSQIQGTTESTQKGTFKIVATTTANVFNIYNTNTNSTIACQTNENGSLYTEAGNADFTIAEASEASVTVSCNAGKFGTVIFPFTPNVSTGFGGITFYSAESVNGATQKVQLTEVAEPAANVPYLIKNDNGENFSKAVTGWGIAGADSYTDAADLLTGVYTAATILADANHYVLQTQNDIQAFYSVDEAFTATAYKCYLTYNAGGGVKMLSFDFGTATGINSIANSQQPIANSSIFNLAGQRMSKMQKGVNIVNGKKVLVK